jgi:uncharacterized lipoprotein
MSPLRAVLVVALLSPLAACGTFKKMSLFKANCGKPVDAASVVDRPPLVVPAGRDAPDTRSALSIPKLDAPEAPRQADSPCIDTPPKYVPAAPKRPQA